jgi:NAD(P)-dependent dehydrogenase (short-subunit alcohol dehydrogenase family)
LFGDEGARVVVSDIDAEAAKETVALMQKRKVDAVAALTDVTDDRQAEALSSVALRTHGRIDVLFNNAGISGVGALHEISPETWDRVMDVNVRGIYLVTRHVVPHMIARRSGNIINMSSALALIGVAKRALYAASKGAVLALTKSMQVDYAPYGIRVNALLPGTILTPFVERYLAASYADREQGLAEIRKRQLTGELGTPEDIAAAALFLASDESRLMMASGLVVDAGLSGGR